MVKKLKAEEDQELANAVRTTAFQIWQAGLGAFAKAQEEGGRVFNKLVEEGNNLQRVSKQASGSWDKLEQVFEDRVARALSTIGVPTQKDIQELTRRVEELSRAVSAATGRKGPAAKAAKKAAAKPPAKKAAAKKAAAKPAARKAAAKPAPKKAAAPKKTAAKVSAPS